MDYTPGLVSASIFEGKKKASNPVLSNLFSKKAEPVVSRKTEKAKKSADEKGQQASKQKEGKDDIENVFKEIASASVASYKKAGSKRKQEDTLTPTVSKKRKKETIIGKSQSIHNPDKFPYVHESLLKKSQQEKSIQKKKSLKKEDDDDSEEEIKGFLRKRRKRDKTSDKRTLFIGNCPLSADKKVIKSLFKDYGAIETIRFRCAPTAKLELPKRAVVIKKEFHEKAKSYVCFVVFKEEESAAKGLEKNGHVLDGHHLRVDLASNQNQHDKRKSIFVGNLPFSVTEEDLRSFFEDCGDILNVRVVRDRQTSIGKGIAYVQFDSKDGVMLAQKLNDMEFHERKIRVMRCSSKAKLKKPEDNPENAKTNPRTMKNKSMSKPLTFEGKAKDYYSRSDTRPEKSKVKFAPTNKKSTKKFKDIFEAKKEKKVKKMMKRKLNSQKKDGLSSIFGDISSDMKKLQMENPRLIGKDKKPKDKKKAKMAKDKKNKKMEKGNKANKKSRKAS